MAQAHISKSQSGVPYQQQQSLPMLSGYESRQISYPSATGSFGAPVGYPGQGMSVRGSVNPYASGQFIPNQNSTMGGRTGSRSNLARQSRSLGASKASVVSERGGKTNIRREYQDKKLRRNLQSPMYGKGRTPFFIAVALFVLGGVLILLGVVVLLLRFHNNIMLSIDKGEIIGPLLISLGIASLAGGIKFLYDAYIISNNERNRIKFTSASDSLIQATTNRAGPVKAPPTEMLMSGTVSANAVSRTPHGSMGSLNKV
ncbi:hypothetical protein BOX15_Mlig005923g1 [Macrostomum lignano]|uniref:Uncharacterized protein n=1 Tax=Macrostomum lignano TaxID=282301 RepID=A0A267H992_9PLAT|nr:hypothetical protein BOX15_Mlig005923g1 [Macrostomum lignano]